MPSKSRSPKWIMSIRFSKFSCISYVSSAPCPINLILREPIILILFDERVWLRNSHYGIFSCVLSFLCHGFYTFYSPPSFPGTWISFLVQSERPCFRSTKSTYTIISLWACILILKFEYKRGEDKRLCSGSCWIRQNRPKGKVFKHLQVTRCDHKYPFACV